MSETIVERTERIRREDERRLGAARVEARRDAMHAAKNRYMPLARAANSCSTTSVRVTERHADVAAPDLRIAFAALAVFTPFAAVALDGVLNGGTLDWLIVHAGELTQIPHPVMLRYLLLAVIVLIEVDLGLRIQHARDEGQRGVGRARSYIFTGGALVIVMAVMTLIITTSNAHAKHIQGYGLLLPWVSAAITALVHTLTIWSGEFLRIGASWISYRAQMAVLLTVGWVSNFCAERARQAVGRHCGACVTLVERHNADFPEQPLRFGPIDSECEAIIRSLFALEDVDRWLGRGPRNPPPPRSDPPPPSSTSPTGAPEPATNADATNSRPEAPMSSASASVGAADNTVDTAYSTLIAEEEARRADSEVIP
jgi:hypothetical protein